MTDRYELASAIFGTKRAEADPSTLSTAIITGTAVEDSESGMVRIIPDGNVIAPEGEDNSIVLPTSPNVKSGDNVIIISTGGTATTPIVAGASGSGDRLLAGIDGIETLIRETADGVLVAKVGQTVGALVNADGSFDVVEITGWNDSVPTVGGSVSSFGERNTYVGVTKPDGEGGYITSTFSILPHFSASGMRLFSPLNITAKVDQSDLSFSDTTIATENLAKLTNNLGRIEWGEQGTVAHPDDYPWVSVTPTDSRSMLVRSKLFVGEYGRTHTGVELTPDGDINADGTVTAAEFAGNLSYSFANGNLCSQSASDWEQGGISSTGANLNRTHTIRLSAASRMEVEGGTPYYFDIEDGYTVNVKPYTSDGTFYEDPKLAAQHIQRYPFIWVPQQDGYLRLTCTIDGSTALAPSGIETALPVVRKASAADFAAVIYAMELNGYAY